MTAVNKKPSALIRRLKKWKRAIADWAAYRLILILLRTYVENAQQPEAFVVSPAGKVDSRLKILLLTPRHNGYSAANETGRCLDRQSKPTGQSRT